ncbi:hypothetical protein ACWC0C_29545 [Streptomyces sp. NPDC001709]
MTTAAPNPTVVARLATQRRDRAENDRREQSRTRALRVHRQRIRAAVLAERDGCGA